MLKYVSLLLISLSLGHLNAQTDGFTLKQCIEYAWMNNLDVRQYILNTKSTELDAKQARLAMLPSVNTSAGQNYQFGRTIDRFTNTFINQTIRTNNFSLNASVMLYSGMQNINNIKSKDLLNTSNEESIQTIKNQIALSISAAFLQAIQAEENIKNAQFQIESTKTRIERAQKLVDVGTTDLSALLSLKAQLANEELNLVTAENSKASAIINLKTLMQMPVESELNLSIPEIGEEIPANTFTATEIYQLALGNMPQVKSAEMQYQSSIYQAKYTHGFMAPSISLYGNISTVYSQSAKTITGVTQTGTQPIGYTQTNNETVLQPTFSYNTQTIDFSKQLRDNLGQSLGLSMSWTLFNGFQIHNQYQKAKIQIQSSEINLLKIKNTLLNDIQIAITNYNSALARYQAAKNNIDAQKLSLDYVQKRYDAGASTSFDFIQAKNSYLQAQSSETQARYELLFRALILEYYQGKPIQF
ncbi:MAG: TolC family protein [Bacteroidetes bacterium]|nr:TolC family protein [Bacteroidota bacterium]